MKRMHFVRTWSIEGLDDRGVHAFNPRRQGSLVHNEQRRFFLKRWAQNFLIRGESRLLGDGSLFGEKLASRDGEDAESEDADRGGGGCGFTSYQEGKLSEALVPRLRSHEGSKLFAAKLFVEFVPKSVVGPFLTLQTQKLAQSLVGFGMGLLGRHRYGVGVAGLAKIVFEFSLQKLLGVVEARANRSDGSAYDVGDFLVAEPVDFEKSNYGAMLDR